MKKIKLTQGKYALVDNEDFKRLNRFKWHVKKDRRKFYAGRHLQDNKQIIYMHREIMNTPKGLQTDHRDGDGLNNRRENLRICSHQTNQRNRIGANKNNILKVLGVSYNEKYRNKYQARIRVNGKDIHLGMYSSLEKAVKVRKRAEIKYFT